MWTFDIAGLVLTLHEPEAVLAELDDLYGELDARAAAYAADRRNPHLCHAGCSECCSRGAFFAVSLVEAVRWSLAIEHLPASLAGGARRAASALAALAPAAFARARGPADVPGQREEAAFTARVARFARDHRPACPLLVGDLCTTYGGRPFLCRAYGLPVDAYSTESATAVVFRSLCRLYEGLAPASCVAARDLRARLAVLSHRLAGGRDVGRFTSAEAIVARLTR
jgi:hypothetical protein